MSGQSDAPKVAWEINDREVDTTIFCFVMAATAEEALQAAPQFDWNSMLDEVAADGEEPIVKRAAKFDAGINETDLFLASRMFCECPTCGTTVHEGHQSDRCDERDDGEPENGIYCDDIDREDELYPVIGATGIVYCTTRCWIKAEGASATQNGQAKNVEGMCLYAE